MFANKNTPPFRLPFLPSVPSPRESAAPHELILPGVGWAAGTCQQPARFCKLINDTSLSREAGREDSALLPGERLPKEVN